MRSRFSAFCVGNGEYLVNTHHPETLGGLTAEKLSNASDEWRWTRLDVLYHNVTGATQSEVAFNAWYLEKEQLMCHSEVSTFVLLDNEWKYQKGNFENRAAKDVKYGRNDPCPCGQGKKYKKCHGH